jgi:hypothetical protein
LGVLRSLLASAAWAFVLLAVFRDRTRGYAFLAKEEPEPPRLGSYIGPAIQEDRPKS